MKNEEENEIKENKKEVNNKSKNKERKMKITIIFLVIINILIVLSIIFGCIDKSRLENDKNPIFSFKTLTYLDGGTQEYLGLGYKIIKYPRNGMDIVDIGTWFLQYKDGYAPGTLQDVINENTVTDNSIIEMNNNAGTNLLNNKSINIIPDGM